MTARAETLPAQGTRPAERQILVILGAPGAGKGTQASRLAEALDLQHISTGDLFRTAIREGDPVGAQVKRHVERGALVPDELVIQVVGRRLAQPDAEAGAVLDGFPRTRRQAEALDDLLAGTGHRVTAALYIEVDPADLVARLAGRRVCSHEDQHVYHLVEQRPAREGICDADGTELVQRGDDQPETIQARLDRQLPPMYEVIDHYADRGVLCAVPGSGPIDEITADLVRVVAMTMRPR